MRCRKILSALLSLVMLVTVIPGRIVTAYAASDAMTEIESALSEYQIGDTVEVADDGYIGIPVEATTYYDVTNGDVIDKYYGTPIMLYVVNTCVERIGTDSDVEIIESMLDRGYVVTVIDYLNNAKAVSPGLDWSMIKVRDKAITGSFYTDKTIFPSTTYDEIYTVPAGYDIDLNNVFWEFDKHGTDGTLERIVEFWNNDFRGCRRDYKKLIKWVHEDGTRKATQNGFDGSAPKWYNEDGTENAESGEWTYIQYTKAVEVTDPVRLDGSPLDHNLYATAIYPTNPRNKVAVMTFATSSEAITLGLRKRPHFNGFLFRGYAGVTYDYGFVPTEKEINTYYANAGTYTGGVTGDNKTYSLQFFNDKLINTAAMRWIRYVAKTDDRFDKWDVDNSLGVYGISKSGWINFLGTSHPEDLPMYATYLGHHGETRYDNGLTQDIVKDGYKIDGGEPQPWLTANGEELESNVDFIYQSVGANYLTVTEDFCPAFIQLSMKDGVGSANYGAAGRAVLEEYDIPGVYLELPIGHDFAHGIDPRNGADGYDALYDTAAYYLQKKASKVVYITPVNGEEDINDDAEISIQFTGPVSASEITKVTIKDSKGISLNGTWESSFGNCLWTFNGEAFTGCETYTITVPNTIKGDNGLALQSTVTSTFDIGQEVDYDALEFSNGKKIYNTDAGSYVYFTMPDKSEVSGFVIDSLNLRFKVDNDAANVVKVYGVENFSKNAPTSSAKGTLIDTVNLRGDGYYQVNISDYVKDISPGTEVAFFVETQKAMGETVVRESNLATNNGGFALRSSTTPVYGLIPGTNIYGLSATVGPVEYLSNPNYQAPDYSNTIYNTDFFASHYVMPYTTSVPENWYGRRFHVELSLYDTVTRDISLYTSPRNTETFYDHNWNVYNMITKPNEETTLEFDYQVYDADLGKSTKGLLFYVTPSGEPEKPFYITKYKITEIITDVEISEASIVIEDKPFTLETEYGVIPEMYKSAQEYPFVLFKNSDKSFVKAYTPTSEAQSDTLYEIFQDMRFYYKSGYTLLMRRDFAHAGASYSNHTYGEAGNTIDLGGFTLSSPNAPLFDIAASYVTTSGAPMTSGYTVKNGKIAIKDKPVMSGFIYKGGDGKTYDMDFENVEFIYAPGATVTSPMVYYVACPHADYSTYVGTFDITYTNCTFNFKNNAPTGVITLFSNGNADGTLKGDVKIVGGKIIANNDVQLTASPSSTGSITFQRDAEDKYISASLLTGKSFTGSAVVTTDGTLNFQKENAANGYDNYILEVPLIETVGLVNSGTVLDIRIYDGNLYVFSGTQAFASDTNKLTSEEVLACLSSTNGYTLSYVDTNKNAVASASVIDGFIKAEKEGVATLYIPINNRYQMPTFTSASSITANSWETTKANVTYSATNSGVGGKDVEDTALGFTSTGTPGGYAFMRAPNLFAEVADITTYTVEFNMYVDGDAILAIGLRYADSATPAYRLLEWRGATGDVALNDENNSSSLVVKDKLETGKWHRVAFNHSPAAHRWYIFVDGAYYGRSIYTDNAPNNLALRFILDEESGAGRAYFDDFEVYSGYYNPADDKLPAVKSASLIASEDRVVYDANAFADMSALITGLMSDTGASNVKMFTSDAFTTLATDLKNSAVAVLTTTGNAYHYYDVNRYDTDNLVDAGYYAETGNSADKDGIMFMNALVKDVTMIDDIIVDYGMCVYATPNGTQLTVESDDVEGLVGNNGYFNVAINGIPAEQFGIPFFAIPFVTFDTDGDMSTTTDRVSMLGTTMSGSINDINKYFGAIAATE